jgi:hypothetical protein
MYKCSFPVTPLWNGHVRVHGELHQAAGFLNGGDSTLHSTLLYHTLYCVCVRLLRVLKFVNRAVGDRARTSLDHYCVASTAEEGIDEVGWRGQLEQGRVR